MPAFCCVIGCGNRAERDAVKFFRIPKVLNFKHRSDLNILSRTRQTKWLLAIRRGQNLNILHARICSKHFISGQPADLQNTSDPDWIPCIEMGYVSSIYNKTADSKKRQNRLKLREENRKEQEAKEDCPDNVVLNIVHDELREKSTMTDFSAADLQKINECLRDNTEEIVVLKKKLANYELSLHAFEGDDGKVKYHTGLPSLSIFKILLESIEPYLKLSPNASLNCFQQFLLTLMKLRLNIDFKFLGYLFNISPASSSAFFKNTINVMHERFSSLVFWPERDVLMKTMPNSFRESFGKKITVIIDCFEIFIEKPSNKATAAKCWSQYKHHYTVKFLIGITPQGVICFISKAWGGRTSDKFLTENCGFFNFINPGDVILADRGFLISDFANMFQAEVKIPAFTKGQNQLHPLDLEQTRAIANVRIHVERVIGLIRNKFTILRDKMPISFLQSGDDIFYVDKVVNVCAALINICPPIVTK